MVPTPDAKDKLVEADPARTQQIKVPLSGPQDGPRIMSSRDLSAEDPRLDAAAPKDRLARVDSQEPNTGATSLDTEPLEAETGGAQQVAALSAPSLNAIIDQAVGVLPGTATTTGLGIPDFLTPGTSSISGIFGGVAIGGLALGGAGGGSAGILSGIAASSSALSGRLVNGYISGARVYQDLDGDGVYDTDEPSSTTAADGSYELTIVSGGGSLIAEPLAGTVDQSTGATVTSQFSAPSGATVISPISTLVNAGLTESQVKTALGIDTSIDLLNFDPVEETLYGDDPDKALDFKSASVLVSNLLDVGSEVIGGAAGSTDNFSDQVVTGIVGLIRESGSAAVDLADADTVGSALTKAATAAQSSGVAIDPTASSFTDTVTGMKTQIASANAAVKTALIDHAGDPEAALRQIAKVEKVAQDSLAAKARAVADGSDDGSILNLDTEINNATVPDVIQALTSATTPGRGESGVSSVYSDAFGSITPTWSVSAGSTISDTEIVTDSGDTAKKVTGADSVTITLPETLDASEMDTLHVSVWRSKPSADLTITLVDYGADGVADAADDGDDSQHVVTYNAANGNKVAGGQWIDLEIELTDLTDLSSATNLGEIQISSRTDGAASGETLYLDNIYFGKNFKGFDFNSPNWDDLTSGWSKNGSEGAFIPPMVAQEDENVVLGLLKGGIYAHVVLGTGTSDAGPIIDPVNLSSNPVLGMWVHAEQAGSEIRIQLGDSATGGWPNDQKYTEAAATTTQAGWNYLTFDFNNPAERFVANGATNGSRGYTAATKFDPDTSYDMLSIFPDLSVEAAIGRVYYFDDLAPYTGIVPDEPLAIAGSGTDTGSSLPEFIGLDLESAAETYNLTGFQGGEDHVSLATDPDNTDNTVIRFTKTTDAKFYAGVQLGLEGTETVGPINFDIANDQTAISARIWVPEDHLDANDGSIIARMEVGNSIFNGAVDINFVHAEAELTQAGWNDVLFDFSQPVERWVTSYGRNETVSLSDSVTYDRVSIFIDWENGEDSIPPSPLSSDVTYFIDDISPPGEGLSGGYTVPEGYVLAFEDNFDEIGQAPDAEHWTLETGATGWGNQELQNYTNSTDNSVIVDVGVADGDTDQANDGVNGALRITAKREGGEITSARVKSDIDTLPAYGYYEIRAKLPSESGAWPAIWLLGDMNDGGWPATGEIDMVEWSSKYFSEADGDTIIHALHMTDRHGGNPVKWEGQIDSQVDDWHTYQLWWTPEYVKLGVDGGIHDAHLTYNKPSGATNDNWPYEDPMDIIMNVAIGGTLGGDEYVPSGSFNYEMYVDYVRVYQTPPVPTAGPVEPDEPEDGFIAVLDVANVSSWRTDDSVNSAVTDLSLSGNSVKQYSNVTQFTIEPSAVLDVSDAYSFQFSVYRTDPYADLKVKLVDFGADGVASGSDNTEHEIVFSQANDNSIGSGQWVQVEIKMSDLTGLSNQSAIGQIVVSSHQAGTTNGSGETLYLDDLFFSPPPVPTAGPTAPDDPSSYVISLFSNQAGYEDLASISWSSDSDQANLEAPILFNDGNEIKQYTDVDFIEIEPASVIDASLMDTLKLDVWRTSDTADLKLALVDYGPDGTEALTHEITLSTANGYPENVVGAWTHIDIPLSEFPSLSSTANLGKIVISSHEAGTTIGAGETLYLDNLFFTRPPPPVDINFELDDSSGFDLAHTQANLSGASSFDIYNGPVPEMLGEAGVLISNSNEAGLVLLQHNAADPSTGLITAQSLISEGKETVSMKTYLFEDNVNVRLRLEDVTDGDFIELTAVTGSGEQPETLIWDFADSAGLDHGNTYSKASLYFETALPIIFDDVQFNGAVLGD